MDSKSILFSPMTTKQQINIIYNSTELIILGTGQIYTYALHIYMTTCLSFSLNVGLF